MKMAQVCLLKMWKHENNPGQCLVIVRFVLVKANQMHGKVNNFELKKFVVGKFFFFFFWVVRSPMLDLFKQ